MKTVETRRLIMNLMDKQQLLLDSVRKDFLKMADKMTDIEQKMINLNAKFNLTVKKDIHNIIHKEE